jgi:myosin V
MAHNYDVGTKAWQPDSTEGWVASEVVSKTQSDDKITLVFKLANGEVEFKTARFQGMESDTDPL